MSVFYYPSTVLSHQRYHFDEPYIYAFIPSVSYIHQILNRYIEIELEDGFVPSNVFSDIIERGSNTADNNPDENSTNSSATRSASGQDCSAEELAAVEAAISSVRQLHHPGLSLALYSVVNAYNGVCNATTSPNVDALACGFEDSVIKIWSLTPHWPHQHNHSSSSSSSSSTIGGGASNNNNNKPSHTILSCDDARLDDPFKQEDLRDNEDGSSANSAGD